jgi:DNA-binding response OmpR family regulator
MPVFTKIVLLVDDDPADLALFSRHLSKHGLEVFATATPHTAIARLVSGDVGCVVTDQAMLVSGHELLGLVRGIRSDVAVIFLSGSDTPRESLPAGVPFINKRDVAGLVKEVLKHMSRWVV